MRRLRAALILGALAALLCLPSLEGAAQSFGPGASTLPGVQSGPGPVPANNHEMAMTGHQIAGIGGKCLQFSGIHLAMNACQPDLVEQRFKFENGRLMTAGVIVTNDIMFANASWVHACVSYAHDDHSVFLGSCRPSMGSELQTFNFDGRMFRGHGNQCLDVLGGRTDNGAPVISWECHGDLNQQWVWH